MTLPLLKQKSFVRTEEKAKWPFLIFCISLDYGLYLKSIIEKNVIRKVMKSDL